MDNQIKARDISDFDYTLPEAHIAYRPKSVRTDAKLLVYKNGIIQDKVFSELGSVLPKNSLIVSNDTEVFKARLRLKKKTGAHIEILLLEPAEPRKDFSLAFQVKQACSWYCKIRNLKKWKDHDTLEKQIHFQGKKISILCQIKSRSEGMVSFEWYPKDLTMGQVLEAIGDVPLPPYIKRQAEESDSQKYQTVFSKQAGAIAAPTAGLHFTQDFIEKLKKQGHYFETITLHVGVGTFQPVQVQNITQHEMHTERVQLSKSLISALCAAHPTIAVGTTAVRTLESLYWHGLPFFKKQKKPSKQSLENMQVLAYEPYRYLNEPLPTPNQVLEFLTEWMEREGCDTIKGTTQLFILPEYSFRISDALITNFHLPKSTLLVLVEAFIGKAWKTNYAHALKQGYRFLSYGDTSLLFR